MYPVLPSGPICAGTKEELVIPILVTIRDYFLVNYLCSKPARSDQVRSDQARPDELTCAHLGRMCWPLGGVSKPN